MSWLTRMMAALLRCSAGLLPSDRRGWVCALQAEADEVPAGRRRFAWLAGGMWLTVRAAARGRRLAYPIVFVVAAAGTAWSAWSGPPGDSAIVINRIDVMTVVVILAGLPWAIRRAVGPVADARSARVVRAGSYAALLALVLVKAAVERVADAPPNNGAGPVRAWMGEIVFLAVMTCYAAVILACTARRSSALPATVAIGTVTGTAVGICVYTLGPLGFPLRFTGFWPAHLYDTAMALGAVLALCAPVAAGRAASRAVGSTPTSSHSRQCALAGLCTGAASALVVAMLSTATIALLPYDSGLRSWAVAHIGHWSPIVGQVTPVVGTRLGYVAGNSAFAAGYLIVLLLGPVFGCGIGAWAGRGEHHSGAARRHMPGSGIPTARTQ